jgi:hypothetical protein
MMGNQHADSATKAKFETILKSALDDVGYKKPRFRLSIYDFLGVAALSAATSIACVTFLF